MTPSIGTSAPSADLPLFKCAVYCKGHPDYEEHRYQYATSSHGNDGAMSPAAIVYPQYPNADADVKRAIQWAADRGVAIAVRTGGHQYCGVSSTGGANIQLDMSRAYTEFEYDAATGLLHAGISHKLIDFRAKLAERGLFVAHGQCSHVRVGGHAQTGGYGQLSRAFGLFGDHIMAIRIITADQEVRELTRDSTIAADQELFWAVLGGSPGNFGVLTHVTIRPRHDEDHPNARGMKFYALYKKEKVQKLLQIMAEMAADDEFPGDYDYCVTVVSAGQSILPAYDFRDIDAYMRTRHPGTYGDNDKMGWPAAIVVYVQWANLGGAGQTFDDAWFNKIKAAASEGLVKPIFELKADKPTKMSQMTDFWVFKNVREFEMPYKKRTYATNSTDLAATGWAAATAQRIEDLERDFANGCNAMVQIQHYGGRHSAFARGDAARRTSYSFRDTSVIAVMDCFYEDARGAHAFVHRLLGKAPAQVADKWQRGNDAAFKGPLGTFSRGFDRRVLWGSYISDASESNMGTAWPLYHEDSEKYDKLCAVKRRVDPRGVFTPNAFCVGVPTPAPTHA